MFYKLQIHQFYSTLRQDLESTLQLYEKFTMEAPCIILL